MKKESKQMTCEADFCNSVEEDNALDSVWLNPFWDSPKFKEAADDNWNVAI